MPVSICNTALARAGVSKFISSLEDDNVEADMCRHLYPQHRDDLLVLAPWPFATAWEKLAEITDGAAGGYAHAYSLPTDCMVVQEVFSGRSIRHTQQEPFTIAYRQGVRVLLTDRENAEIRYTARVENTQIYPPGFRDALAWKIAMDVAAALTAKSVIIENARRNYEISVTRAVAQALGEGEGDPEALPPALAARMS